MSGYTDIELPESTVQQMLLLGIAQVEDGIATLTEKGEKWLSEYCKDKLAELEAPVETPPIPSPDVVGSVAANLPYRCDKDGWVRSLREGRWQPTGVCLPRLAGKGIITAVEVLDECDVVYGPLSSGIPRRDLL